MCTSNKLPEVETYEEMSESVSSHHSVTGSGSKGGKEEEKIVIANQENRVVGYLRLTLVLVLVAVGAVVATLVYLYTSRDQEEDFRLQFADHAEKVIDSFQSSAERRLGAVEALTVSIVANAKAQGQTWPFIKVPEFEERISYFLDLAAVMSFTLLPLVTKELKDRWEIFSYAHQDWLQEGLDYQESRQTDFFNETLDQENVEILDQSFGYQPHGQIRDYIFKLDGAGVSDEMGDGPYFPWWQFAPSAPFWSVVNYDASSHPGRGPSLSTLLRIEEPLVSSAWDYADLANPQTLGKKAALNVFLNRRKNEILQYEDGPVSDLYYPIFEKDQNNERKFVGALTAYVYWQIYFENVLPENANGVYVLLENDCGQQFTYTINGPKATYLGPGDLHDPKYDGMELSTGLGAFIQYDWDDEDGSNTTEGMCKYGIRIFPSQALENSFTTKQPMNFTMLVVSVFALCCMVFLAYDVFVEKRQRKVMAKAVQSTAVVNSLYPEAVRDRLFNQSNKDENSKDADNFARPSKKLRDEPEAQAIANLHDNCSVFFADIAGFTRWSDGRNPQDVLSLLESLYKEFDKIARRRRVFKVETIGDCYLAVTGIPNPQPDHAVRLVKFANDVMTGMNQLIHNKLVQQLGEDTASLSLRVGIHSGPVTAGVLRGDRARFQIFGDTVNTASRMESTGSPGKIQVTAATAALLTAAKKEPWLMERAGGVVAKGKGNLKTFWVMPNLDSATKSFDSSPGGNLSTMSRSTVSEDSCAGDLTTSRAFSVDSSCNLDLP